MVANYIYGIAQLFNTYYAKVPIATAKSEEEKDFRLLLTKGVSQVLEKGLNLLGIEVVEKM
jgi:arginyl-tRNA synthetase